MTTQAQLAANQRNATKSTGPTSAAGKAAASQNALTHGFTAREVVCAGERHEAFEAFAAALRADLAPADEVEAALVERIVTTAWRLRRLAGTEKAFADSWREVGGPERLDRGETPMSRRFDYGPDGMTALSRYEASLDRALGRAFTLLDRRQARRRGEYVPAPVAVLVDGVGDSHGGDSANPLVDQAEFENCETNPIFAADAE
ncbi:MAG TPA: hypothetical protein VGL83_02645 [Stellaceae bacterium]